MIYILCVIHVSYWLGMGKQPLKSLILIEMPVIFFISGAAMTFASRKGLYETTINRAKRVLFPYYIYFAVSAIVCIVIAIVNPGTISIGWLKYGICTFFLPKDNALPLPYMSHLWFIVPYLLITCSFCFQQKIADRINRWLYMVILVMGCIIAQFAGIRLLSEFMIYNVFFISGYFSVKKITTRYLVTILSATIIFLIVSTNAFSISIFPMQYHKFPPDLIFLTFGIIAISALGLIFDKIKIPNNRILRHWNKNGFTIYLYQNLVFAIYVIIIPEPLFGNTLIDATLAAISIFLLSTMLSFITVPIEKFSTALLQYLVNYLKPNHLLTGK